jgi:SAM-dependent methyltransferase
MMRAHNEVEPQDPDNHLHLLHQLTIGVAGGSLSLTDTHGPVIWRPRMHIPDRQDIPGGLAIETPPPLQESSSRILGTSASAGYGEILLKQWPRAIARDLSAMREIVLGKASMDTQAQRELLCSRHWREITGALGYPVLRPQRVHEPLPVNILEEAAAAADLDSGDTPAEETPPAKAKTDVYACTEAAEHLVRNLDGAQVKKCVALLEDAAFCSMIRALQSGGTLTTPGREYPLSRILSDLEVAPRHQGIISRWLRILTQRGYVKQRGESYSGVAPVTEEMMRKRWDSAMAAWNGVLGSRETIDYLASNAEHLPRLMRDEQQAALLLFPEGRMDIADALYRNALTARYLNRSAAEAVMRIMAGKKASGEPPSDNSLKILEIGAGTGATTEVIVGALKNAAQERLPVNYLFTDVSNFFLAAARKRFKDCPWMDFAILDINQSLSPQGIQPESVDIIIAAGMLNNARDTDKTIRDLMALLAPGGWMVITEPVREFPEMLISQAFMMTPPEDGRKSTETTFMSVEQWLDVFLGAGGNEARALPEEDHPLSPLGQKLFIARRI